METLFSLKGHYRTLLCELPQHLTDRTQSKLRGALRIIEEEALEFEELLSEVKSVCGHELVPGPDWLAELASVLDWPISEAAALDALSPEAFLRRVRRRLAELKAAAGKRRQYDWTKLTAEGLGFIAAHKDVPTLSEIACHLGLAHTTLTSPRGKGSKTAKELFEKAIKTKRTGEPLRLPKDPRAAEGEFPEGFQQRGRPQSGLIDPEKAYDS